MFASIVVVGFGRRTRVGNAQIFVGDRGRDVAAVRVAIAAVEGAGLPLEQRPFAGLGEDRWCGIDNDRAGDAVAAGADRRDAGEDLDAADIGRVNVGKRRIHVIGAG